MPRARTTNNSVATLEEQTELIRIMSEKGSKGSSNPPPGPSKVSGEKKKSKRKVSAAAGSPASLEGEPVGGRSLDAEPAVVGEAGLQPVNHEATGMCDVTGVRDQNNLTGVSAPQLVQFQQPQMGAQFPYFMPQPLGFQGFYPQNFGFQPMGPDQASQAGSWDDDAASELDELSQNMLDAMQLLALTSRGMENRRREALKPSMQHSYARVLGKPQEGDPQWLYGGNLSEATRKCEVAKRLTDKLIKRKGPQGQGPQNKQGAQGGQNNQKRFKNAKQMRQNFQQQQMMPRMFGYQQFQPQMQQMNYQYQYPNQQQQGYQNFRPKGQRHQQPSAGQNMGGGNQDFQKRGAQK